MKELEERLQQAQMVLVGIGKEMEEDFSAMEEDPYYASLLKEADEERDKEAIRQYLELHYLKNRKREEKRQAYRNLAGLLEGKNYFIVTLCTDDYIFDAGLDPERIVAPCGGYRALQCAVTDENGKPLCVTDQEALVTDPGVWESVLKQLDERKRIAEIDFPVCAECCRTLRFNKMETPGYREEGYLSQWGKYTRWLQGTLNRNLCVMELGAGMEYPSVIRFPFEKVVYFNRKAYLYRIHSRLYQLTEELKGRGTSVKEDPLTFLLKG